MREVDLVLDRLVRETVQYVAQHPESIRGWQPQSYERGQKQDTGLTERLKAADLLSEGYCAVVSGTSLPSNDAFTMGNYKLCVYNLGRGFERDGVNVELDVQLQNGSTPGIENAVGTYRVAGSRSVFMEEERTIVEGWSGKARPIRISL